jgi:hypothetical protein
MTTPIDDLQNHVHFQLSLLKLVNIQNGSESISAAPPVEIAEQQHLQDALAKIAGSIQ